MTGSATMDWDGSSYELDGAGLGYKADFSRDAGPDSDAPFERGFPSYSRSRETIILPAKGQGFTISGADADETLAGEQFKRTTRIVNGAVEMEASTRTLVPEVSAADARAAQARLRALDEVRVFVKRPDSYRPTDTEMAARLDKAPTTADDYLDQAQVYFDRDDMAKSLAAADKAIALTPNTARGHVQRALVFVAKGKFPEARVALTQALAIDPDNNAGLAVEALLIEREAAAAGTSAARTKAIAELTEALAKHPQNTNLLVSRGRLFADSGNRSAALHDAEAAARSAPGNQELVLWPLHIEASGIANGSIPDPETAIANMTRGIALEPRNAVFFYARARANMAANSMSNALADAAQAIAIKPDFFNAYMLRANIYHRRGDTAGVLGEARAVTVANPKEGEAYVYAAGISCSVVDRATCMAAFDRAIAVEPSIYVYINRLQWRAADDVAGRRADIAAGLKLDPENADLLAADAELLFTSGDYQGAVNALASLTARQDAEGKYTPATHLKLGIAMARSGQKALADREIAGVMAQASANASALNSLCWNLAIANVALDRALAACDAALALQADDPAFLDSRGFVQFRRGDYAAAIASYDKAIAIRPKMPESLYGRGLARQKKGETAGGNADIAAARALKPDIVEQFAGYLRAAS
jgi:tetratricopeptide (TPR) repeat protein